MQVSTLRFVTGCGSCANTCPAKEKSSSYET